jgi:hypothetical protein
VRGRRSVSKGKQLALHILQPWALVLHRFSPGHPLGLDLGFFQIAGWWIVFVGLIGFCGFLLFPSSSQWVPQRVSSRNSFCPICFGQLHPLGTGGKHWTYMFQVNTSVLGEPPKYGQLSAMGKLKFFRHFWCEGKKISQKYFSFC